MLVRNRNTLSRPPKAANLAGCYGKIGISAVETAARYGIAGTSSDHSIRRGSRVIRGAPARTTKTGKTVAARTRPLRTRFSD
jgi:hypothetical protein